jgi:DNA ligase-1
MTNWGNYWMLDIVSVFQQIKGTSSRTGKEAILKANEYNTDFRRVLEFIYNPFILTGIKGKKLQKFASFYDEEIASHFNDVFDAIDFITTHNSGRDDDVKAIASFINDHTLTKVHDFLQDMFTKDYKCGITSGTINKVYGKGTIPEFDVMLAKSYKDHGHKLKGKFYITLKLDGIRCLAIKKNGAVQFFTRQGQPIDDLIEIEEELMKTPMDNFVFDGELLLKPNGMDSSDLFRATQKVVRKDGEKKGLDFHIFDGLLLDEFMEGKSNFKYEARRKAISVGVFGDKEDGEIYNHLNHLKVIYEGDDKSVISDLLAKVIAEGHEGLMINTAKGLYVTKRSDVLLKVKEMYTVDLRVVGFEHGEGRLGNTLGALIVDYKGYKVKVGSGFSDSTRELIWSIRDEMIGKIIEVQYFEESSNQDGGISLRFPVYKQTRDDKTEASYD